MSGNGEIWRGVIGVALVFIIAHLLTGCGTTRQAVDLGDGKVAGVVPVSAVAKAADIYQPGAGKAVNAVEAILAARRDASTTNAPFGGLPYTEQVIILLKEPVSGLTVTREQIATIRRTRTAITPEPIVEDISIEQVADKPASQGWGSLLERVNEIRENLSTTNAASLNADALEALGVTP